MTTYVLVPGAGGAAWYWHRVVPLLQAAGHVAIAVDLPADDETAGLPEYVRRTLSAIGERREVVVVGQSLGAFTATLIAATDRVRELIFVNAMIPRPGETPGAWWANTGWSDACTAAAQRDGYPTEFDDETYFLHDVPADVVASGAQHQRPEADAVFGSVLDVAAMPTVPIRVLAGAGDRFFPLEFQQAVARDRLGLEPEVLPGGHLVALSQPQELVEPLLAG